MPEMRTLEVGGDPKEINWKSIQTHDGIKDKVTSLVKDMNLNGLETGWMSDEQLETMIKELIINTGFDEDKIRVSVESGDNPSKKEIKFTINSLVEDGSTFFFKVNV